MINRFRIRAEHLQEMLAALKSANIEPLSVYDREDGAVAVEVDDVTEAQGRVLAAVFRPEWSAIIGIVGGNPFENNR